ncbi:hypothetical protein DFH29DRAFT_983382 [Suillus ampliporus]|nr:hypothetical protein DFH29DRAFT_983382 [Suillus ampliporus]
MIHLEGRCQVSTQSCLECDDPNPEYRCWDCLGSELYCSTCILSAHKWNSQYFEQVSLKALGLCIQLGHTTGQQCSNPHHAFNDEFIIINTLGIHKMSLDFCDLKTAAMFCILEQYHLLSFESKVSAYEFYHALNQMSDNTGLLLVKVGSKFKNSRNNSQFLNSCL